MPRRERSVLNQLQDRLFQTQQPRSVADGCSIFPGFCGYLFLRQVKFIDQALEGPRLFNRVEVFPLNILNQCYLERRFVADFSDDRRYSVEAGALCCAPSPFASEELKT